MKYALMRSMDISNWEGVGVSLFVQGCHFHCKGCFNAETWSFNGGKEWTQETKDTFLKLADKPYVKRISILGGEPLAEENINDVVDLMKTAKEMYRDKLITIHTGYTMDELRDRKVEDVFKYTDVMVTGRFVEELKDIRLKWRGSSNQRIWVKQNDVWIDATGEKG